MKTFRWTTNVSFAIKSLNERVRRRRSISLHHSAPSRVVFGESKLIAQSLGFTYDIDFHVQLVRLLLVLLVARARLRRWRKIQVTVTWWGRLEWALRERDAAVFSRRWLLGRVRRCLRLTAFVARRWCFLALLQVTASIGRLVACLIDRKRKNREEKSFCWRLEESYFYSVEGLARSACRNLNRMLTDAWALVIQFEHCQL